jgi:hypothetical protein
MHANETPAPHQGAGTSDAGAQTDASQTYLRSTIGFPYSPLKDAELIAKELQDEWGGKASPDQLAAGLNASPKSGSFRTKIATARTFGVTSATRGSISLTDLGRKLIDPQSRDVARVEAFMAVPLFAALAEEYKGSMLPPDSGLERKIRDLGVSAKQTAKARQAFQRSAEQAGFFKHGRQRLVPPANVPGAERRNDTNLQGGGGSGDVSRTTSLPGPLVDLWVALLDEGAAWSPEKIQEYVVAARLLRSALAKDG